MQHVSRSISFALCAALSTATLVAQDTPDARTTTESRPALTVRTTDSGLSLLLGARVLGQADPIDLGPGEAAQFEMNDSGEFSVSKTQARDYLWVDAHPAGLMAAFPEQMDMARRQLQAFAGLIALSGGGEVKDIQRQLGALIELPRQIDRLQLRIPSDPSVVIGNPDAEEDVRVIVEAIPVADSGFAKMHSVMRPSEHDVPLLSGTNSLMSMSMNMDFQALEPMTTELFTTVMEMVGGMMDDETKQASMSTYKRWMGLMKGTGSMVWDAQSGMLGAFSIDDPEAASDMLSSTDYQQMFESVMGQSGGSGTVTEEFEHRGSKVMRFQSAVPLPPGAADQMPFPMFDEDGNLIQRIAVAGDYMVLSMFDVDASAARIRSLIDAAAEGEIRSRRSQDLMRIELSLPKMAELSGRPIPTGVLPNSTTIALRTTDRSLRLELRMQ